MDDGREKSAAMKIVTYNVNGLRQRISQFGSLLKLLNSFDADIICFQETKLRRQELTADLIMADGYESFFSCTRTNEKGRIGYSGVATFCRVRSAFSSSEVALPIAAEEGFTGLLLASKSGKDEPIEIVQGLEEFDENELLRIDNEGRCIVTDHSHFVLFNVYGPRAEIDDTNRLQFKLQFFTMLQKRWESLLQHGRRLIVVGDLNIAPSAIDRCDAGPDFENNQFRIWFRSLLMEFGGHFFDVFRNKHPDRREAYTCWPSNTGAEQFNFGSRIDHIICSGSCLHQEHALEGHNFAACNFKECDILMEYKRWKPGSTPRWKGGWGIKLEGSDHAPVYAKLVDIPSISEHSTPPLSARHMPMIHGLQQTIVSVLTKRQNPPQFQSVLDADFTDEGSFGTSITLQSECVLSKLVKKGTKKARKGQHSQLSLTSFYQNSTKIDKKSDDSSAATLDQDESCEEDDDVKHCSSDGGKNCAAVQQWQRIQLLMQNSIPLCKGHKEPCVARRVKKLGPTFGCKFYVCARAEGPASNAEANCGYFRWASSTSRRRP